MPAMPWTPSSHYTPNAKVRMAAFTMLDTKAATTGPAAILFFDIPIPEQCIACQHYLRPHVEGRPGYPIYNAGVLCGKTGFRTTKDNTGLHTDELIGCEEQLPKEE